MNNKEKFKKDLNIIEIETFSYCNRVCWFCPNSVIDRRTVNYLMPIETYENILYQLQEINYNKEITYSRYNEPLAQKSIILERLKKAREILPNSILRINTNGDYLTTQYIQELKSAGLNQLWIQQYLKNNEQYNHEKSFNEIQEKIKKLGFNAELITNIENEKIEYNILVDEMTVHIRARNYAVNGSSRGNTVPISQNYERTKACDQPFNNMYIDYNGSVMVCCALRSDVPEHENGIMNKNVNSQKIWDIFYSGKYEPWRNAHKDNLTIKEGVCKTCKIGI